MKIEGDTIIFRSSPENYFKERDGLKCNTIRRFTFWSEMKAFDEFREQFNSNNSSNRIRIVCVGNSFERIITDITEFDGLFIISWRNQKPIEEICKG